MISVEFARTGIRGMRFYGKSKEEASAHRRELRDQWKKLLDRAQRARLALIQQYETRNKATTKSQSRTYAEIRNWLLDHVFHGKCAYCEGGISNSDPNIAHTEHYRPLNGVESVEYSPAGEIQKKRKVTVTMPNGKRAIHKGYFWLACEWNNILPSCDRCNQNKKNKFAVKHDHVFIKDLGKRRGESGLKGVPSRKWPGWHYLGSKDLDGWEEPDLLNPYRHEPMGHIDFSLHNRPIVVDDITPDAERRAQYTIYVLGLHLEDLSKSRLDAQTELFEVLPKLAWLAKKCRDADGRVCGAEALRIMWREPYLQLFLLGKFKYSAACRDHLASRFNEYKYEMMKHLHVSESEVWEGTPELIIRRVPKFIKRPER